MNLLEHIRAKDNLVSLWELVEFMKQFNLVSVANVVSIWDRNNCAPEDVDHRCDLFGGFEKANADFDDFLSGLGLNATSVLALSAARFTDATAVVPQEGEDPYRETTLQEKLHWEGLRQKRIAVNVAFCAEASKHLFFYVADNANYYRQPFEGWDKIVARWPNITKDVEQASLSMAFGLHTAVVFHVVRCAEYVLKEVCVSENIPHLGNYNMMGNYLADIEDHLKKNLNHPKKAILHRIQDRMKGLKEGWRDPTMHTGTMYEDYEALAAYRSVQDGLRDCLKV